MKIVVVADNTSFNKPDNYDKNYIESSYELFLKLNHDVHVQCPEDVKSEIVKFVPEKMIWTEPVKRGTAPALGLASIYARAKFEDELTLFAFANQTVEYRDKLLNTLKIAENLYDQLRKIILIGVAITERTDKYGYIEVGKVAKELSGVLAFEMKSFQRHVEPSKLENILSTWKYLWDTGYVIGKPSDLLKAYKQTLPDIFTGLKTIDSSLGTRFEKKVLNTVYASFLSKTFSEGVIENIDRRELFVIPVDLGITKLFERVE